MKFGRIDTHGSDRKTLQREARSLKSVAMSGHKLEMDS